MAKKFCNIDTGAKGWSLSNSILSFDWLRLDGATSDEDDLLRQPRMIGGKPPPW
jgi:hypothetical protein